MRKCSHCGAEKPLTEFYARDKHCKPCRCDKVASYRQKNAVKIQAYDLLRLDDPKRKEYRRLKSREVSKEARRNYQRAAIERHPEKRRARIALGNAVQRGDIQRPGHCVHCGASQKLEAHHEDYSRPLDVLWLCRPCHLEVHKQEKRASVFAALNGKSA